MAIYSGNILAPPPGTGVAWSDVKASATGATKLIELSIAFGSTSAALTQIGIGRSTAELLHVGGIYLSPEDPNDQPTQTEMAVAWSVFPIVPAQFFRRANVQSAPWGWNIFTFPSGILIAQSQSIILWAITGSAANINNSVFYQVDE